MAIEAIISKNGAKVVGPYTPAVRLGDFVFCSGQIGVDPKTGELAAGGIEGETKQVMDNIKELLAAAGVDFAKVVRMEIFLADMKDYQKVNEIYAAYFGTGTKPARHAIGVASLPRNARIEITCTAYLG
jgi:2-iminobutanoate/2-iminopropanoate deaminase